jgi:agmatinase
MQNFNPNDVAVHNGNFLGLPYTIDEAEYVIFPVCLDVTTSYKPGTSNGPKAVIDASYQLDLFHPELKEVWKIKLALDQRYVDDTKENTRLRKLSEKYISFLEQGGDVDSNTDMKEVLNQLNEATEKIHDRTYREIKNYLQQGKKFILLGGDHSTPIGYFRALNELRENPFSILQIDAHADLRKAYEGFEHSHASICYNAIQLEKIEKLVQLGIRDICEEEVELTQNHPKVKTFFDWQIKEQMHEGKTWSKICDEVIAALGDEVYITFDIDGFDPKYCPNTGTPVPGGFEFSEIMYLFKKLSASGKKIIGMDLVEVAPGNDEWDGNVGARTLFNMIVYYHLNNLKQS